MPSETPAHTQPAVWLHLIAHAVARTADLLEPTGAWTPAAYALDVQGGEVSYDSPFAVSWSILGAFWKAADELDLQGVFADCNWNLCLAAVLEVSDQGVFIDFWEESEGRTQAEVVGLLRFHATRLAPKGNDGDLVRPVLAHEESPRPAPADRQGPGVWGNLLAHVLERTADMLEPPGAWTSEARAVDREGREVPYDSSLAVSRSMLGAFWKASDDLGLRAFLVDSEWNRNGYDWNMVLASHLGFGDECDFIDFWEEREGRTQEEVVRVLRAAARRHSSAAAADLIRPVRGLSADNA